MGIYCNITKYELSGWSIENVNIKIAQIWQNCDFVCWMCRHLRRPFLACHLVGLAMPIICQLLVTDVVSILTLRRSQQSVNLPAVYLGAICRHMQMGIRRVDPRGVEPRNDRSYIWYRCFYKVMIILFCLT